MAVSAGTHGRADLNDRASRHGRCRRVVLLHHVAIGVVLVAAHGNSIRAIVKHIACISDEEIAEVNIPTGIPLLYEFDSAFEPINKGGRYLDPKAAEQAISAVANQGKK